MCVVKLLHVPSERKHEGSFVLSSLYTDFSAKFPEAETALNPANLFGKYITHSNRIQPLKEAVRHHSDLLLMRSLFI